MTRLMTSPAERTFAKNNHDFKIEWCDKIRALQKLQIHPKQKMLIIVLDENPLTFLCLRKTAPYSGSVLHVFYVSMLVWPTELK